MDLGIAGKVALVTASSTGLGNAIAHALAAEGVKLVLFSRSAPALNTLCAEIEARYAVPALAVAGDMQNAADVERLVETLRLQHGGADILVLNTGRPPVPMRDVLEETDDQRWEAAYRVQLWGAILVARSVVPLIIERGWGRVIAITSASVKQPMPHHGLSTVFRAGVTAYMKHLANEVAAKGVTVNTVCPASIGTESLKASYETKQRIERVPLKRLGTPQELAATVAFLASQGAGYITGASVHVDGGMVGSLY